ncbi:glycosyltransferase family 2 protein [Leeuwenhoekiella polynyae]|nr:glycosyltransferase family 2 protein [Leeuwenhoekiella polynyae]
MVPTYGQELFIEKSVRSAMDQDYPNLEIIISDDCSPDNTRRICENLALEDERITYYYNSKNLGRVKNYHETLYHRANGDYVVNLDGDDCFVDNEFISKGLGCIIGFKEKQKPLVYVACKRLNYIDHQIDVVHDIENNTEVLSGEDFLSGMYTKYKFSHLTTIYNRDPALKLNFYSKDFISSDTESLVKLISLSNVIVSKDIVGQWNAVGNNESLVPDFKKNLNNLNWIESSNSFLKNKINTKKRIIWKYKSIYFYSKTVLKVLSNGNLNLTNFFRLVRHSYFINILLILPVIVLNSLLRKI